mgnify:CR=1 FL=1
MFKVENKNFSLNRLKCLFVITILIFSILLNPLNFYSNQSKTSYENSYNVMACAGAISWPAFAATAVSTLVLALIPGSRGIKVAEELTKNGAKMNNMAKALSLAAEKVSNPNPVELAWTVVDIIISFLPAGAGMKMGKIALTIPKLITSL